MQQKSTFMKHSYITLSEAFRSLSKKFPRVKNPILTWFKLSFPHLSVQQLLFRGPGGLEVFKLTGAREALTEQYPGERGMEYSRQWNWAINFAFTTEALNISAVFSLIKIA